MHIHSFPAFHSQSSPLRFGTALRVEGTPSKALSALENAEVVQEEDSRIAFRIKGKDKSSKDKKPLLTARGTTLETAQELAADRKAGEPVTVVRTVGTNYSDIFTRGHKEEVDQADPLTPEARNTRSEFIYKSPKNTRPLKSLKDSSQDRVIILPKIDYDLTEPQSHR